MLGKLCSELKKSSSIILFEQSRILLIYSCNICCRIPEVIMVDLQKAFSLNSSRDHFQRFSPSQFSGAARESLSSGLLNEVLQ